MSGSPTTLTTEASYRTLLTLAIGGMGRIDVAVRREGSFERLFAVKRLLPELASEPEVRAMFLDEARIAGLIRHPNVVSVLDVGQDEVGPFAVMELVDGISVAQLIAKPDVHPLPMELALRITLHVAEGLHAAHELTGPDAKPLELVHRDVSPQNILLGFDGIARVTDFGIAKALGRISKTSTGVMKGKLGYLSPEQLRFEEPDRRADLFALGVVLFELLTGQRLYRSQNGMDGPRRILGEPAPDLADYRDDAEPELVELLFELLAKQRSARPANAKLVARRIDAILAKLTAAGPTIETADFLRRHFETERRELESRIASAREQRDPVRSRSPRFALGAAAMIVLAGLGGWFWLRPAAPSTSASAKPPAAPAPTAIAPLVPVEDAAIVAEPSPAPAVSRSRAPSAANRSKSKPAMPIWEKY